MMASDCFRGITKQEMVAWNLTCQLLWTRPELASQVPTLSTMPLVCLSFKTICWAKLWTSSEKRQQPWMIQCLPYSMTVMGVKTVMTSYYASSITKLCRAAGS